MFHFKLSTKHPQLVDGLWKFIQIPTSHQPMKSNFPGIQFRVLTVYTETGILKIPTPKNKNTATEDQALKGYLHLIRKSQRFFFLKRKDGYLSHNI